MRRRFARLTIAAAASCGLVATTLVHALGLGEISVESNLNQRFAASIPLTEISAEDLETVTVSIAPNDAFDRAGIDRAEYLSSLNFSIRNDHDRPRVVISSSQLAREPVINLLVQARWKGGKILRDYTVLLDPPEAIRASAVAAIAPKPPVIAAAPITARPAPIVAKPVIPVGGEFFQAPTEAAQPVHKGKAPVFKAAAAPAPDLAAVSAGYDSATGSYGPIAPKETLWSIAAKVRPGPAISMDQVLLALSESNPAAIQRGTTVDKGAMLKVPSAEQMAATPAPLAKQRLLALRSGHVVTSRPVKAAKVVADKPAPRKPVEVTTAPTPAPPVEAAKPAIATPQAKPEAKPEATETAKLAAPAPAPVSRTEIVASPAKPAAVAPAANPAVHDTTPPSPKPSTPSEAAPPPVAKPAVADTNPPPASADKPATNEAAASPTAKPVPIPETPPPTPKPVLVQPPPAASHDSPVDYRIPVGLGALILMLGVAAFNLAKRRKPPVEVARPSTPVSSSPPAVAPGAYGAAGKLGDTTRLSDTQALGTAAAMAGADATQQITQQVLQDELQATQQLKAQPSLMESTLIIEPAMATTLNPPTPHSAVIAEAPSFDKTTQVEVDALHINLDTNDPVAEADFHLAYGLYDEAILLLKNAAKQEPARKDIEVKLAETYFAAGRPMEFQEVAEGLHGKLDPAEWSKLAIMGAQICPGVTLFQSGGDAANLAADFDLAFDESDTAPAPAAAVPAVDELQLLMPSAPAVAAAASALSPADRVALKLEPDDYDDLHDDPNAPKPAAASAGLNEDASIDFMLDQSLTPLGAGLKTSGGSALEFDLSSPALDLALKPVGETSTPRQATVEHLVDFPDLSDAPTIAPPSGSMDFSLQDIDVSLSPRSAGGSSKEAEFNTKLDLARAYIEMGDNEMARGLLSEVQQQGGDTQKKEASAMLQRLSA